MRNQSLKALALALMVVLLAVPFTAFAQDTHSETTTDTHSETTTTEETATTEEESSGGLAALGINQGFLIAQIVNFLVLAGGLTFLLWKPAVNMLDARAATIQKGLEDAVVAARARQNAEAEAEKVLVSARADRQKAVEEARQQGEAVKKQIETDARAEADRIRNEARQEAISLRNAELANLRDQVLKISTAVAGRILNENLDEGKQKALVSDFFSKVPADAKNLSGEVTVVSAMPLTDDEKKKLEGAIKASSYSYTVDPEILGGLIVRSQDKVVDGSVRSNLSGLTSRLK